jgi:hypothetical protein
MCFALVCVWSRRSRGRGDVGTSRGPPLPLGTKARCGQAMATPKIHLSGSGGRGGRNGEPLDSPQLFWPKPWGPSFSIYRPHRCSSQPSMLYPGPYPCCWFVRCGRCHQPYQTSCGSRTCGACLRFLTREYERADGRNQAIFILEDRRNPRIPMTALAIIKAFTKWPVMHVIQSDSESDCSD